jgi:hypothetical protein
MFLNAKKYNKNDTNRYDLIKNSKQSLFAESDPRGLLAKLSLTLRLLLLAGTVDIDLREP